MPLVLFFLAIIIPSFLFGFDQKQTNELDSIAIEKIIINGNKRTKNQIVLRELEFSAESSLKKEEFDVLVNKSRENLINTSLFNFVEIFSHIDSTTQRAMITINLVERWFILPFLIIKSAEENMNTWWLYKNTEHLSLAMTIVDFNFRGRREQLVIKTNVGYDRSLGFSYTLPYVNQQKTIGLQINANYGAYKELIIGIDDFEYQFHRNLNGDVLQEYSFGLGAIWRPYFRTTQQFNLDLIKSTFSKDVIIANSQWLPNAQLNYLRFSSKLKIDYRNNKAYPTEGYYADFIFVQNGLGIWSTEDKMQRVFEMNARFYQALNKRFFWASGLHGVITKNASKTDFFGEELGNYNNELRAYEHYRIPFEEAIICKNNLKFQIVPKTIKRIPFIKTESVAKIHYAVYLNAFFDAALIKLNKQRNNLIYRNDLKSNFLYSSGVGLDFVTYYDMVFRFEYSRNFEFNDWGFFIHLRTSI